ncbi:MAG: glycosyltransferase family 2 protein [Woeseia sp.]
MEALFWVSFLAVFYTYFGYPLILMLLGAFLRRGADDAGADTTAVGDYSITVLIPAHNEASVIGAKIENTLAIQYPGAMQLVVVSDGSVDGTGDIVRKFESDPRLCFIDLPERKGKGNALNQGIAAASGDIVVFSDASIILDDDALIEIIRPFANDRIGCVSGEDMIEGGASEGLYGRYELYLRNQESRVGSIVGASGSFYAQRRAIVPEFPEGIAPDLLSVLHTVTQGYRAISCPAARGYMTAVADSRDEFQRKVRTVIRGMTAIFKRKALLNPFRYPVFSLFLLSHKVLRWCVPFFLIGMLLTSALLLPSPLYSVALVGQLIFYGIAIVAWQREGKVEPSMLSKVALFFSISNVAIFIAWIRYLRGVRQEIWTPSRRA